MRLLALCNRRELPTRVSYTIIRVNEGAPGQTLPIAETADAVCLCVYITLNQEDEDTMRLGISVGPFAYKTGANVADHFFVEDDTLQTSINALLFEAYKLYDVWFKEPVRAFDRFNLWLKYKDEFAPKELNRYKTAVAMLWPIWQAQSATLEARSAELKQIGLSSGGPDHVRVTAARMNLPKVKRE